jgi:hypothetical protein
MTKNMSVTEKEQFCDEMAHSSQCDKCDALSMTISKSL